VLRRRICRGSSVPLDLDPRAAGRQEACHVRFSALATPTAAATDGITHRRVDPPVRIIFAKGGKWQYPV
jgi:hypothetical protein